MLMLLSLITLVLDNKLIYFTFLFLSMMVSQEYICSMINISDSKTSTRRFQFQFLEIILILLNLSVDPQLSHL